jgi:hypothetical protein
MLVGEFAMSNMDEAIGDLVEQARRAIALKQNFSNPKLDRVAQQKRANELLSLVESIAETAERLLGAREETERPCWFCGQAPRPTESDLENHIQTAAQGVGWSAWPKEDFIAKMRAALEVGDRIVHVSVGGAQVRRRDGRIDTVWRRDG